MSVVPRLAVVVLNWNGRVPLTACLDSLAGEDRDAVDVIVVDNGSEDGSAEMVRARGDVELVALEENRRFAAGNNAGAEVAIRGGADILLILNNDTRVVPGALGRLVGQMQARDLDLAGPRIVYADRPDRIWYGGGRFSATTGFVGHRALRRAAGAGHDPAGPTDWVTGCALAIRADLWQRLGGLDDAYYIYSEDVDLCLRARAVGATIGYCPEATIEHEVSASVGGRASPFKVYHRTRARRQLMRRHGRGPLWSPCVFGQDIAWAALLALRGEVASARAVLEAVGEGRQSPPRYRVEELGGVQT
jgi:GT2 family glycosyltransferase